MALRAKVLVSVEDGDRRAAMVSLGVSGDVIQLVCGAVPRQLMEEPSLQVSAERPWTHVGLPPEGGFGGCIALGGLLPADVASIELVTLDGQRRMAETGSGVWVSVLPFVEEDMRPLRVHRDADGAIVHWPGERGDEQVPLPQVTDPCPACGETDWEECVRLRETGAVAGGWHACSICGTQLRGASMSGRGADEATTAEDRADQRAKRAAAQARRANERRGALDRRGWWAIDLDEGFSGGRAVDVELGAGREIAAVTVIRGRVGASSGWISLTLRDPAVQQAPGRIISALGGGQPGPPRILPWDLPWLHSVSRKLEQRRAEQRYSFGESAILDTELDREPLQLTLSSYDAHWQAEGSVGNLALTITAVGVAPEQIALRTADTAEQIAPGDGPLRAARGSAAPAAVKPLRADTPSDEQPASVELEEPVPVTLNRVKALIEEAGFGDHAAALLAGARPGWRLELTGANETAAGACRFGGRPDLTADEAWPHGPTGTQMVFIAQIDLGQLPPLPDGWPRPLDWQHGPGLVRFFADLLANRGEPCAGYVAVSPPGEALTRTDTPEIPEELPDCYLDEELLDDIGTEFPERSVRLIPFLSLPETFTGLREDEHDFSATAERYAALTATVRCAPRAVESWTDLARSQLLGEPLAVQADPRETGTWMLNGLGEPENPALGDAGAWSALLQIQTDMEIDIEDGGAYTFILPSCDLAAGAYNRVICDVQTG